MVRENMYKQKKKKNCEKCCRDENCYIFTYYIQFYFHFDWILELSTFFINFLNEMNEKNENNKVKKKIKSKNSKK